MAARKTKAGALRALLDQGRDLLSAWRELNAGEVPLAWSYALKIGRDWKGATGQAHAAGACAVCDPDGSEDACSCSLAIVGEALEPAPRPFAAAEAPRAAGEGDPGTKGPPDAPGSPRNARAAVARPEPPWMRRGRLGVADAFSERRRALPGSMPDLMRQAIAYAEALRAAVEPLVRIAEAYHDSRLDEARPEWAPAGRDPEPGEVELLSGRGGARLLTLADCLEARRVVEEADRG